MHWCYISSEAYSALPLHDCQNNMIKAVCHTCQSGLMSGQSKKEPSIPTTLYFGAKGVASKPNETSNDELSTHTTLSRKKRFFF